MEYSTKFFSHCKGTDPRRLMNTLLSMSPDFQGSTVVVRPRNDYHPRSSLQLNWLCAFAPGQIPSADAEPFLQILYESEHRRYIVQHDNRLDIPRSIDDLRTRQLEITATDHVAMQTTQGVHEREMLEKHRSVCLENPNAPGNSLANLPGLERILRTS